MCSLPAPLELEKQSPLGQTQCAEAAPQMNRNTVIVHDVVNYLANSNVRSLAGSCCSQSNLSNKNPGVTGNY
ncbi:hypothetical protein NEUTE1DRAFT_52978 [Neurospora tetrasperma FGSC 2508]|uniref:Uncharacterized protein n=1 Tax=Neurospora tetrasperma (strain FGSC 2508 / ATCC MYA-4615 / P0657) TaxID=510951 RepID=F8N3L6_NEUT8|nr:uncharacterized protein NEUTE1DRAFT_52978 [Neurospora tetrasperma FGSC 2508]EGO53417.1 hypothetical protein NEUTE1DRAFT_52978 [Neurospora tetrasperma FGSC 2508]